MAKLTKEWLQKTIAELEEERDAVPGVVNEDAAKALAAMQLALASLEAEPVACSLIFRNMDGVLNDYVNANTTFSTIEKAQAYGRGGNYVRQNDGSLQWVSDPSLDPVVVPLYSAPPAPVSVPLAIHDEDFEKALSVLNDTLDDCGDSERGLLLALDKAGIEVRSDACRAAMFQGAERGSNRDELTDVVNGLLAVMDEYPETLVPINRDSALVRQLRVAAGD
ncbi:hypothetical protein ACM94A_000615 [Enterobacter hormaechei]